MDKKSAVAIVAAGFVGFYFGSDDGVKYENPEIEIEYRTIEVPLPQIPYECKQVLLNSTDTQFAINEDEQKHDKMLNDCFEAAHEAERVSEHERALINAYNNYDAGEELTEAEVEEAFDECEIDYGDSDYCEDNLEDYLGRD